METIAQPESRSAITPPQQPPKSFRRAKNDQKWDALKQEIHRIYVKEDNTLQGTMQMIEQVHSFKARLVKLHNSLNPI